MRTIWNGTLQLGELAIPVGLAPTVRDRTERFRKLHEACSTPVKFRSWCEPDEQLLDQTDLVAAYEISPGEFLVLTEDELAALEPEESRAIPIAGFVARADLDPLQVRKRYWLTPSKSVVGRRAYTLLAAAIAELDVAALVRFTAWRTEQLGAITAGPGQALELAMLHFSEDLVLRDEIAGEPALVDVELRELALELVRRHTRAARVDDFVSIERPRVRELLEAKLAGEKLVRPEPAATGDQPTVAATADLAGALKRSLKTAPRPRRRATAPAR